MAIQMRRGQLANYDKSKMLPGEWGISIDNDSDNQKAFISFAPGVSKEVMMVEDAEEQIAVATAEAIDMATEEAEAWAHGNSFHVNDYASGDGSTKSFTLAETPSSILGVYVDGSSVSAYTMSGKTITFTTAPASGSNNIRVYYTVNTTTDNAKYYKEQAEAVAESIPEDYSDLSDDVDQLKNALIVNNASGAIASFPDGGDGFSVRDLKVQLEPIQDLHGYDNPWPAGGGKNLFDKNNQTKPAYLDASGDAVLTGATGWGVSDYILVTPGDYIASGYAEVGADVYMGVYDESKNFVRAILMRTGNTATTSVTILDGESFVRLSVRNTSGEEDTAQFEKGTTATSYAPYSNICPISGRTGVTVTRTGVNVWDEEWELGGISGDDGQNLPNTDRIRSKNYIPIIPNATYYFCYTGTVSDLQLYVCTYDGNKNFIARTSSIWNVTKTFADNVRYVRFFIYHTNGITVYNHDIIINYPSTDHDYHAGHVQTVEIPLGQTVYGGTLDVTTGVLTVEWQELNIPECSFLSNKLSDGVASVYTTVNNKKIGRTNVISDKLVTVLAGFDFYSVHGYDNDNNIVITIPYAVATTVEAVKQWLVNNAIKIYYELATPQTYALTAQQMTTLLGQNNVWSDADSVSVDYVADTKLYIEQLTEPDSDMVADMNITSGRYFMVGNSLYLATANIANGAAITVGVNCTRTSLAEALNAINS